MSQELRQYKNLRLGGDVPTSIQYSAALRRMQVDFPSQAGSLFLHDMNEDHLKLTTGYATAFALENYMSTRDYTAYLDSIAGIPPQRISQDFPGDTTPLYDSFGYND